jgi:hypothetical protein
MDPEVNHLDGTKRAAAEVEIKQALRELRNLY